MEVAHYEKIDREGQIDFGEEEEMMCSHQGTSTKTCSTSTLSPVSLTPDLAAMHSLPSRK